MARRRNPPPLHHIILLPAFLSLYTALYSAQVLGGILRILTMAISLIVAGLLFIAWRGANRKYKEYVKKSGRVSKYAFALLALIALSFANVVAAQEPSNPQFTSCYEGYKRVVLLENFVISLTAIVAIITVLPLLLMQLEFVALLFRPFISLFATALIILILALNVIYPLHVIYDVDEQNGYCSINPEALKYSGPLFIRILAYLFDLGDLLGGMVPA